MDYGPEVAALRREWWSHFNFGGAVLLHWEMLQYAKRKGKERFNFYGTIETEAASTEKGTSISNVNLEAVKYCYFDKTLNPSMIFLRKH